jgi:acetate kinase
MSKKAQHRILVLNSGSSSLKFQLIEMPGEEIRCHGMAERLGSGKARLKVRSKQEETDEKLEDVTHKGALERIAQLLGEPRFGNIGRDFELDAVGHRVVHGGERFSATTIVDAAVKEQIRELSHLAPLHNPHNLEGILLAETLFPGAVQVAVFDTAFHRTMPLKARKYAIPNMLYDKHGIQVYGFHGTSHAYVYKEVAPNLPKGARVVSLHLGNGCSATAIRDGKSLDHSLGFTPSNGLIMGSRSGDVDHGIIFHLVTELGYSLEAVNTLLTRESGLLGLTGYTDFRDVQAGAARGEEACLLAMDMVAYRIRKYIGAYAAVMNGLDALIFTAGIGEHSPLLRQMACEGMDFLGIHLDTRRNEQHAAVAQPIHAAGAKVQIWVVPTDEELEIARQSYQVITAKS